MASIACFAHMVRIDAPDIPKTYFLRHEKEGPIDGLVLIVVRLLDVPEMAWERRPPRRSPTGPRPVAGSQVFVTNLLTPSDWR